MQRLRWAVGAVALFDDESTALVIQAVPDDFTTDPSGNSGPRIACGIVEKPAPKP